MAALASTIAADDWSIEQLFGAIATYEPALLDLVWHFLFVPCAEDTDGKQPYIRVLPGPGTTTVKPKAFRGSTAVRWVIVDPKVTHLGDRVFYRCARLTEVTLPPGLTHLGEWAFYGCTELMEARVPEGFAVPDDAFPDCTRTVRY